MKNPKRVRAWHFQTGDSSDDFVSLRRYTHIAKFEGWTVTPGWWTPDKPKRKKVKRC